MLDLLLLAVLGLLFFRGWLRGLIREAVSLAVIVVGMFLALRLNGAVGAIVEALVGFSEGVSRVIAGIFIFLVISVGAALVIRVAQLGIRLLPGATTLNRVGGGVFSAGAGLIVMTLIFSVLAAINLSDGMSRRIDDSNIAGYLTDEDALPQGVLGVLAGDRILATTIRLQGLFGEANALATSAVIDLPATAEGEITVNEKATDRLADKMNRLRVRNEAEPLARGRRVDEVALDRAREIATSGKFSILGLDGSTAQDRIDAAGLRFDDATEIVVLGATVASLMDAIAADEEALATATGDHRRMGVGLVSSVNGLVAVILMTS